ncbi:glycoside hydrolase family 31 protein [Alginatibacterium sediminis]|uniref:Glycoside hydrolase family 31 protein n=1 Tax=Alginatibacterium sediminis TaxID=2164068 RepID=A0A420EH79_9ALTE|nr:glycoside hydrolase family 31 protein [Alginatibacterium sediminis]RKF20065.1 glycoside hydrolase family 31 protein [Alginatibacterium sediminis]
MKTVKNWRFIQSHDNRIDFECDERHSMHIFVLEHDIIRVLFKNNGQFRLDKTWSIAPDGKDVPFEGRERMSTQGFSLPDYDCTDNGDNVTITTDKLRLRVVQGLFLALEWEHNIAGQWQALARDRKTGAYSLGVKDGRVQHYMARSNDDNYYGLGEKTGDLNRKGKRYEMRNLDAMGYNAETTDPLYKHIPFYITRTQDAAFGLFYDNLASCWFDLGNELDNYHEFYRSYRAEDGDLDYYMILGPKVSDVTKRYTAMTGGTFFGPKWSLGYSGSTMHYTDAPNAQEQLLEFVNLCNEHDIPCDSFQLSSGYTSIGAKRYVFNWNYDKVPSPETMSKGFHDAGMYLAANIKPCLLQDHPRFNEVKEQGLFIKDSEFDQPESSVFWDDSGSHLDFTNPNTVSWWKQNVKEQLLDKGINSTWNDNNEYEVWDGDARCFGFGKQIPIRLIRPLQPLLMMRSSFDAQIEHQPNLRPFLISRSGCPGMNRYVQTWTGDNRTNWNSLRYNIRMGVGMSLSGLYNVGHDVGGFSGLRPEPELFARWVQNGVMHPRFTIHSWNDDATVNEPWMYPEVTPIIRDAIALRYQLLPYLYDSLYAAHAHHEPMLRPTFFDHEHDPKTLEECDDYLLGRDLLVASVVEQGQRQREVYLPDNVHGWYCYYSGQWFAAAQNVVLDAPLERQPLLAQAGSIIATSSRLAHVNPQSDTQRQLRVFPLQGRGQSSRSIFDDDGESFAYQEQSFLKLDIVMQCKLERIDLNISKQGQWQPAYSSIEIILPVNETRPVFVNGAALMNNTIQLDSL